MLRLLVGLYRYIDLFNKFEWGPGLLTMSVTMGVRLLMEDVVSIISTLVHEVILIVPSMLGQIAACFQLFFKLGVQARSVRIEHSMLVWWSAFSCLKELTLRNKFPRLEKNNTEKIQNMYLSITNLKTVTLHGFLQLMVHSLMVGFSMEIMTDQKLLIRWRKVRAKIKTGQEMERINFGAVVFTDVFPSKFCDWILLDKVNIARAITLECFTKLLKCEVSINSQDFGCWLQVSKNSLTCTDR